MKPASPTGRPRGGASTPGPGGAESELPGCRPRVEEQLLAEGWQARFVADAKRVAEARETYAALGHEVTTLPIDSEDVAAECNGCVLVLAQCRMIYTRRRDPRR